MEKLSGKQHIKSIGFLGPSIAGILIFYIIPFFVIIYYALVDNPVDGEFVGMDNFKYLLSNEAFLMALKNSMVFTVVAVPLAVILSMLLAALLTGKIFGKGKLRTAFLSPLMVPVASVVLVFQVLFHSNGVINDFLTLFGAERIDWFKSDYAMVVVVLLYLWKNLGYNMILFMAAYATIPKDIVEAARVDGASELKIFFKIKLRYLSPTILFVTILSIISSFKVFREVYLLTGDYPYESLYMLQHFMNNKFAKLDYQTLSAAALVMFAGMMIIIGVLFVVENRFGKDVEE